MGRNSGVARLMNNESKLASRKFWLAIIMMLMGSALLAIPLCMNLGQILTGGEFISLLLGIFGIYSTANVAERHVQTKNMVQVAKAATNKPPFLDSQDLRGIQLNRG